jgi:two-component system, OmpR family, alkaline phosphatase synthesis response regulator PhoP
VQILVVNKNPEEVTNLVSALSKRGYGVHAAHSSDEALSLIEKDAPDIIILDIEQHSIRELRNLLSSGKRSERTQFLGLMDEEALAHYDLALGLDDFVVTPYKYSEIIARLELLRWRRDESNRSELLKCGDLVIDLSKYEVRLAGQIIVLTLKEYELLCFLATNRGKVFSRETLLNKIWGYDYFGGARTVDVHVTRLRNKIEDSGHSFIDTIRGVGYKFKESI